MDPFSMGHTDTPQPPPLPAGLPVPVDDGAADHLNERSIPDVLLPSTEGRELNLSELAANSLVLFIFPKIGRPDEPSPPGWDETPGARGCTQETCAFRDRYGEFSSLGYSAAGLSAQPLDELEEASQRLRVTFPLLADPDRQVGAALSLPTFDFADMTVYRRLTLVARERRIVKVFYPVFPPDENAEEVLEWIRSSTANR